MQYVRSFSGSVSKTWNSINPATLSGAIDVVVVEQEDGKQTDWGWNGWKLRLCRLTRMLPISRSLRQVLLAKAIRKESMFANSFYHLDS